MLKVLGANQRGMGASGGAADSLDLCRHYKDLAFTQREIKRHGRALSGGRTGSEFYFNGIILATG